MRVLMKGIMVSKKIIIPNSGRKPSNSSNFKDPKTYKTKGLLVRLSEEESRTWQVHSDDHRQMCEKNLQWAKQVWYISQVYLEMSQY